MSERGGRAGRGSGFGSGSGFGFGSGSDQGDWPWLPSPGEPPNVGFGNPEPLSDLLARRLLAQRIVLLTVRSTSRRRPGSRPS